jgi:hypothetical protein
MCAKTIKRTPALDLRDRKIFIEQALLLYDQLMTAPVGSKRRVAALVGIRASTESEAGKGLKPSPPGPPGWEIRLLVETGG